MTETATQTYFVAVQDIETPALLLDLDVLESNIAKMAQYFATVPATLRAHCKNHKLPIIAQKQIDAGAKGICVAKLGEAEVMVAGGIRDILITTQVVDPHKIGRLVNLNKQADVKVVVDNSCNVADLSAAAQARQVDLGVLVEVNVGLDRCGVEPGQPALDLAQQVAQAKNLRFLGVQGYEGHTCFIADFVERKRAAEKALGILLDAVAFIRRAGLDVSGVSAAGTGTWNITSKYPGITECQCGSYATMSTRYNNVRDTFGYAVSVLATVLSRPTRDRAVIDAGNKSMTFEYGLPLVTGMEGAKVAGLHVEHGVLALDNPRPDLEVGDKIELIPSFDQTTINLYDRVYAVRKGWLEAVWKLEGRGRSD
jgi:D-serine deaminase-like pyridoxal phosphate-dependent protein